MPPRLRSFYAVLSIVLLLISVLAVYREFTRPADIWWTPLAMAASLTESQDRVEIYARGRPLVEVVGARQLALTDGAGSSALTPDDLRLRFNNRDRVAAARRPMLVAYGAACGIGLMLFFLIITGRLEYRGEQLTGQEGRG